MRFDNWTLQMDTFPVRQYDNLTRRLEVSGDIPEGWNWAALLSIGDNLNIISLQYGEPGLYVDLTADMIPYSGKYNLQLRATQGDKVRHTNIVQMQVNDSMSGDEVWPELPSEFSQAEQRIADLNAHPSKPGVNGYWMVWDPDAQEYRESDIPLPDVSVGPAGPAATVEVAETITGAPGSDASVKNLGTENAALLRFTIPSGPAGPAGTTPQISVTVTTLPAGQDVTVQVSGPAEAPTIAFGIPQGEPGERGPQGLQGIQGWGLSGAALDSDGALVLTIRNPADGQTQTLPPVPIDNSAALQAVAAAITAQGTTQVQRVEDAGDDAVGAVRTAKDVALEAVGQAQTTATGAVASAQTTAVQAVQDAQGTAETAISQAQTDAVGAVNDAETAAVEEVKKKGAAEQSKLNAIVPPPTAEDAGKALVANAEGSGLVYGDAPGGAGIDDAVIATDATWSSRMIVDSLAPEFSETGAVVTCNPVAGYPLSIQAQIVPVQEGSGDPSPENVRPISGWDVLQVTRCGLNLWTWDKFLQSGYVEKTDVIRFIVVSGIPRFECPPIPKFKLSYEVKGVKAQTILFTIFKKIGNAQTLSVEAEPGEWVYASGEFDFTPLYIKIDGSGGLGLGTEFRNVSLVQDYSTPYEPYQGDTYDIALPETVYGGTLDAVTGEGEYTKKVIVIDGEIIKVHVAVSGNFWVTPDHSAPNTNDTEAAELISSIAPHAQLISNSAYQFVGFRASWISQQFADVDEFNSFCKNQAAAGTPVQVAYKLVTPEPFQATGNQALPAVSGLNTIYSDTGNVTVSGRADPNAMIQQLAARIAALESAAVANA